MLACFFISSSDSHSAVRAQEFIELSRRSNEALLEEGISLIDRATTCMAIIAKNYYHNQTDPEITILFCDCYKMIYRNLR